MGINTAKNKVMTFGVILLAAACLALNAAQVEKPEKIFQEVKLLIFDKKWDRALGLIQEIIDGYPGSQQARQALFYKGECLANMKGREREALAAYKQYIKSPAAVPSLVESAEAAVIDLSFDLYGKGDKKTIEEIETRLASGNKAVRYYAAYKLSMIGDRKTAAKSVPVLERILETETDPELLDRARIALLRVSPESLKDVERRQTSRNEGLILTIRIWKKGEKDPSVSINIPWALADLALRAMPEDEKEVIRRKGYDLDRILDELAKSKESLLRIEEEDSLIEIKIEKHEEAT